MDGLPVIVVETSSSHFNAAVSAGLDFLECVAGIVRFRSRSFFSSHEFRISKRPSIANPVMMAVEFTEGSVLC
jgi:hypothetical protein